MSDPARALEALVSDDEAAAFAAGQELVRRMVAAAEAGADADADTLVALGLRRSTADALDARLLEWARGERAAAVDYVCNLVSGLWRARPAPSPKAFAAAIALADRADLDPQSTYAVASLLLVSAPRLSPADRAEALSAARTLAARPGLPEVLEQSILRRL